ncbi:hypothetical protein GW17_00029545 [Ensete ventricosum]|nr:hypothetical protein GW17_00029545 [Ensete ventricosum]
MDGKMDRYQRVEKPRAETPINENEIRITTQGRIRNYITYATSLLQVWHKDILSIISLHRYQPPLPKDQVKPLAEFDYEGEDSPTGRGRGRGGRGRGRARGKYDENGTTDYNDGSWDNGGRGYGRGGYARGRGSGFRGRGRGGYGGRPDYQLEKNGYDDEAPVPVRSRVGPYLKFDEIMQVVVAGGANEEGVENQPPSMEHNTWTDHISKVSAL